jgi:quercetin dioxygenase-like cupin family protein
MYRKQGLAIAVGYVRGGAYAGGGLPLRVGGGMRADGCAAGYQAGGRYSRIGSALKSPLTSSSRLQSFSMVISAVFSQSSTPVSDTTKAFKEDTMKVVRIEEVAKEPYLNPLFTGPGVTHQVLLPDSRENVVNVVHFGKGVRNKFHTHDCEQILIITAGTGVVATEKEEKVVTVGDIVLIPADEKHWHGSNGESDFSHIFVSRKGSKMMQLED